jgi:hypothetical protein
MKTTTIIFILLGYLTAQSQDYRLDSLFYALTKQSIEQSDKIVVNTKARIPKEIWDNYWKRTKQNLYFDDGESEFIKSQIKNPVISRWNKRKLYKYPV